LLVRGFCRAGLDNVIVCPPTFGMYAVAARIQGAAVRVAPLPPGTGSAAWRQAMETRVLPALDAFAPDFILVSAGFDAHAADPLAQMELTEADFAWGARALQEIALQRCQGRLVSTLEGGYDLPALARSAAAYLEAFQCV
jgi:acetoin utilization deacetylase AcuC-like enzyme